MTSDINMPLISCRDLTKLYGAVPALNRVTLSVPVGKCTALLGPNGSGKTTLIKLIAGLLVPTAGHLSVLGCPIGPETKAMVAYLPERNSIPEWMTPLQAIGYFRSFYADFDAGHAEEMLRTLSVPLDRKIRQLSKGTKEKVQLVMVMARRARLYLLDEPISGVDPAARDFIIRTILEARNPGAGILISTHLIRDIEEIADDYLFLQHGNIVRSGTVAGVREETGMTLDELFREVFRC